MRLVEISAWNDSGGGFLNRLLDGHPALHAWPYELLLGTDGAEVDGFGEDWFRGRFRWARLGDVAAADGAALFERISDAELRAVLENPSAAKHRHFAVDVDLAKWCERVARRWAEAGERTQAAFLRLYISTFFELWRGKAVGPDDRVLAHCPVAILDAPEIWADFPDARILHVVRRPEAGFHDMRARHADLDPARYALKWLAINGFAAALAGKYPDRVRIVALDSLLEDREATLRGVCAWLGIGFADEILAPSWNGRPLDPARMGPFGGVPQAVAEIEREAAARIGADERRIIAELCAGTKALIGEAGHATLG